MKILNVENLVKTYGKVKISFMQWTMYLSALKKVNLLQ